MKAKFAIISVLVVLLVDVSAISDTFQKKKEKLLNQKSESSFLLTCRRVRYKRYISKEKRETPESKEFSLTHSVFISPQLLLAQDFGHNLYARNVNLSCWSRRTLLQREFLKNLGGMEIKQEKKSRRVYTQAAWRKKTSFWKLVHNFLQFTMSL